MVKNRGYRDLQRKFFGCCAPDQNIEWHPNEGGADGILGGRGEFAVCPKCNMSEIFCKGETTGTHKNHFSYFLERK